MLKFLELGKDKARDFEAGQLQRIEMKLNLILDHLKIDWRSAASAGGMSDQVKSLADEGRKMDAIKLYRVETGATLSEAQKAVEKYSESKPDPMDW